MGIVDFLKNNNARVSYGNKWLIFENGLWIVMEQKGKKIYEKIQTPIQDVAIFELLQS